MFSQMLDQLREKTTFLLCRAQIQNDAIDALRAQEQKAQNVQEIHEQPEALVGGNAREEPPAAEKPSPFRYSNEPFDPNRPETWGRISRNDPCPCGSGKKFKHCHGRV